MGKGTEYNNNLIDDPGASLAKIVSATCLRYPETRQYLQLLSDQGFGYCYNLPKEKGTQTGKSGEKTVDCHNSQNHRQGLQIFAKTTTRAISLGSINRACSSAS